jgi:hypothetical protein
MIPRLAALRRSRLGVRSHTGSWWRHGSSLLPRFRWPSVRRRRTHGQAIGQRRAEGAAPVSWRGICRSGCSFTVVCGVSHGGRPLYVCPHTRGVSWVAPQLEEINGFQRSFAHNFKISKKFSHQCDLTCVTSARPGPFRLAWVSHYMHAPASLAPRVRVVVTGVRVSA